MRAGIVLRPGPDTCEVLVQGEVRTARWAAPFAPRADRVVPGDAVAMTRSGDGDVVLWRWYDAVVVGAEQSQVRLWEPAHGEVLAQPRQPEQQLPVGSRAYLSAGLPGADWWVAGPALSDLELDEVAAFYEAHDLWDRL